MTDINWPLVSFACFAITNLLAIAGCYYGLKADNAKLAADVQISMMAERSARVAESTSLRTDLMALIATADSHMRDIAHRVTTLESGKDEWTKELRERTHGLADQMQTIARQMQAMAIKVDRLERPVPGAHG